MEILPERLAWYIAGPLLGVLVVGLFFFLNQPLGASGAYINTSAMVRKAPRVRWRVYYFVGIFVGGVLATVLGTGFELRTGYDALTDVWPLAVVVPVVGVGAVVMGYGARIAGGCTSGHGICGTAQRSATSFAVTATFMATAIVVTQVLRVATGGAL